LPRIPGDTEFTAALRDAGVVGNDLLAVDWEATALGAPSGWPSSLRTIVRVVLASRFAMWMAWGPELTFFCNEAYRRETLADKYPWALGRPASEVWAEIWPDIGPRIDHVLQTGEATWDQSLLLFLERSGYEEETYHTFSYSPVYDDDGAIAGMLCVVTEETDRVIGERRIATLRDLNSVSTAAVDEHEFLEASAAQLGGNLRSLPFVCIYTFDRERRAVLNATTGVHPGEPVAPVAIELSEARQAWPASELASGEHDWLMVDDLQSRFGSVPAGARDTPPVQAVVVPLPGATGASPVGFIAVGVNKHRPVDDVYRGFIGTIAQRLGAGVTNARSFAAERERSEQLAELNRAKTAFFSNVSHEFRTPADAHVGAAGRRPPRPDDARCQGGRAGPPQRSAPAEAGQHAARLLQARGGTAADPLRAGRRGDADRGARRDVPRRLRACRSEPRDRLRAAARAGLPGSRPVGAGRAEPALQRLQGDQRRAHRRTGTRSWRAL
jgi:signal transduction histidine kinase